MLVLSDGSVGTFMKPHFDNNNVHTPNKVAAMLFLNNDFEGGNLIFQDVKVKPGWKI